MKYAGLSMRYQYFYYINIMTHFVRNNPTCIGRESGLLLELIYEVINIINSLIFLCHQEIVYFHILQGHT